MSAIRKLTSSILFVSFIATGLWGCGQNASPNQQSKVQSQQGAQSLVPPVPMKNAESAGVMVRNDLAEKLNKLAGVRGATVLMHNGDLYTSFINVGSEQVQDDWMKQKNGQNWKGNPWGTEANPKSAAGMTVKEMQAEKLPNAASFNGPGSTVPGNVSPVMKKRVADTLRSSMPDVKNIYLSTTLDDARQLSGYKHFIVQGGNFRPHVGELQTFVQSHMINVTTP